LRQHDSRYRKVCPACTFVYYRNPVPAAGCLIERGGQVLMVQRRYPPHAGAWTLPAGFVEWDETPEQAAARETEEETGLQVAVGRLFGVFPWYHEFKDGLAHENGLLVVYEATVSGGELQPGDDAQAADWFAPDALPEEIAFASHQAALGQWKKEA
jgi:ADP-ribose pyrophosphatase YjhB (NUDIX family)